MIDRRAVGYAITAVFLSLSGNASAQNAACSILKARIANAKQAAAKAQFQAEFYRKCKGGTVAVGGTGAPQGPKLVKKQGQTTPQKPSSPKRDSSKTRGASRPSPKLARPKPTPRRSPVEAPLPNLVYFGGTSSRFRTLQAAVDAVAPGGTVIVESSYRAVERIEINKSITVSGVRSQTFGSSSALPPYLALETVHVHSGSVFINDIDLETTGESALMIDGGFSQITRVRFFKNSGTTIRVFGGTVNIFSSLFNGKRGAAIYSSGDYRLSVENSEFSGGEKHYDIIALKQGFVSLKKNKFSSPNNGAWLCMGGGVNFYPFTENLNTQGFTLSKWAAYIEQAKACR